MLRKSCCLPQFLDIQVYTGREKSFLYKNNSSMISVGQHIIFRQVFRGTVFSLISAQAKKKILFPL